MMASLPPFLGRRRVCVQAGGNWGYWPHLLASLFETVYTFEPDHECFCALVHNTIDCPNVVRLQAALGHCPNLTGLWRDADTTGNQHVEGVGIYPTLRIDDLGLDVCDLIYLDVEGSELAALMGARETIGRARPVVAFEVTAKHDSEGRTEAFMGKLGYGRVGTIGRDVVMAPC